MDVLLAIIGIIVFVLLLPFIGLLIRLDSPAAFSTLKSVQVSTDAPFASISFAL